MTIPLERFQQEWAKAKATEPYEGSRAAFATATAAGRPSVRYVLVKEVDETGFYVFTNYESRKALALAENPFGALTWHWHSTGVQVRVEGPMKPASSARSDAYFEARPRASQLGAWASLQSQPFSEPDALQKRLAEMTRRFEGQPVPRPERWGGYVLSPEMFEFWYDGEARLHERYLYRPGSDGAWVETRLFP